MMVLGVFVSELDEIWYRTTNSTLAEAVRVVKLPSPDLLESFPSLETSNPGVLSRLLVANGGSRCLPRVQYPLGGVGRLIGPWRRRCAL